MVAYWSWKKFRPTDTGNKSGLDRKMNGSKKLLHVHQKVKMTTVAIAGLLNGMMICQRTLKGFAPSITAASSSSRGMDEKNWRSIKIKNGLPKNARINNGHNVLTSPSRVKNS